MLILPFAQQETDYYCGPAVLQMILQYYGRSLSQTEIATVTETATTHCTPPSKIIRAAESYGLYTKVIHPATLSDLKNAIDLELPVIIDFRQPESDFFGHYAIAKGYDEHWLYLQDSEDGPETKYAWEVFDRQWFDHDDGSEPTKHWLAIVSDKPIELKPTTLPTSDEASLLTPAENFESESSLPQPTES